MIKLHNTYSPTWRTNRPGKLWLLVAELLAPTLLNPFSFTPFVFIISFIVCFLSHLVWWYKLNRKECLEIPWASLRGMVEPGFAERSLIQHKDYLTGSRLIVSNAVDIRESEVLSSEGRLIPYDYLVIATGHGDPLPKTRAERLKQYQAENEKIKAAQSILIVGGGPTGVELAGEIAVDFPEKKITLVHNGYRLLEFLGPKASKKTLDWLTSRRVEVKLEQTVNLEDIAEGSKLYKTSAGEIIRADCHFLCTGKPLASSWLNNTILEDSLDDNGNLVVDGNLRVKGRKNIFAVGDITNIKLRHWKI